MREILLSIHLLGVIVWLGAGFYELWLGRVFMKSSGSPAEAALIRAIYRSDLVVFAATIVAFGAGLAMAVALDWGFFEHLWLGVKQAIALVILAMVVWIFPTALRLGAHIAALPPGDGPVPDQLKQTYGWLEPRFFAMRGLGVVALLLAVWKPESL